jgi:hypothetical protein
VKSTETVSIFMMGDEAPAATTGGVNGETGYDRPELNSVLIPGSGPISLVAAEIHLGQPAVSCDGWLHCTIQIMCQFASI